MDTETSSHESLYRTWLPPRRALSLDERYGTPAYVYSARKLRGQCRKLVRAFPTAGIQYAMKANSNPEILREILSQGLGVDTVSPWEVRLAREAGFTKEQLIYSGNNPSDEDLVAVHRAGVTTNLDALSALERYGRLGLRAPVSLRVNMDVGGGHHPHVITGGADSKFGLAPEDLAEARSIALRYKLRVSGLHQHIGSGIFDPKLFVEGLEPLLALTHDFDELSFVDAGGGFGVPYKPGESAVDLEAWSEEICTRFEKTAEAYRVRTQRSLKLLLEPGRFVVCEAGVLLTRVTNVKRAKDRVWIGVDTGMHHLVRPALYQSWHPVQAIPEREGERERCFVVGPICESGDVLAEARWMVPPREGDLLAIGNAGAYGFAMASHYNLRPRPVELMVDGKTTRVIRPRERYRDLVPKGLPKGALRVP